MHTSIYRQTLAESWRAVWHHKALWAFGLLSLFLCQFGLSDFIGQLLVFFNSGASYQILWEGFFNFHLPAGSWESMAGLVWVLGILLLVVAGMIFISVSAQGAAMAYALEFFKKGKADMGRAWHRGVRNFWAVLFIHLLRKVFSFIIFSLVLLLMSLAVTGSGWQTTLILLLSAAVLLMIYVAIYAIAVFSIGYRVATGAKLSDSLFKGSRLFSQHVLVSLEVGLVMAFLNILVVAAILLGFFLAFMPSMFFWLAAGISNYYPLAVFGQIMGFFFWLVFSALICGIFNAYNLTIWMRLFVKMHHQGLPSRVIHHLFRLFKRKLA